MVIDLYMIFLSLLSVAVVFPIISFPFIPFGIYGSKANAAISRTTFQNRCMFTLAIEVLVQLGFRVVVDTIPLTETQWLSLNGVQSILILSCCVFLARSTARRLCGIGLSKHYALLLALPVANLLLCLFIALSIRTPED